jgi:UDP-N-acetylglucosamine--N-acetylmuramyl-(pentapeptide) pyrophosphoryl-undecaprenol N-acetylglucosamine transferase
VAAWAAIRRIRPAVVVGFGGYPTVPPILGACLNGVPVVLHEQNAVMGRANRFVAGRAAALATGFPRLGKAPAALLARTTYTGNPVRPAVFAAATAAFRSFDYGGILNLLVTGGSQGARVMADVVPVAAEHLDADHRARLRIVQQARGEDEARVRDHYRRLGVAAEVAPFFADLPARMAAAHLVIARAGASTVSELSSLGRPDILVPFPHALDQDQAANAAVLGESGSAVVCDQKAFTPDWLAVELIRVLSMQGDLPRRAEAARLGARPDAAERLADLVLAVASRDPLRGVNA